MSAAGRFIAFEGIDGSGKSTCIERVGAYLREQGVASESLREPGSSRLGELLRGILMEDDPEMIGDSKTEALLFYAARMENIRLIRRSLGQGTWVLTDRFNDSSIAYQSYDGSIDGESLETLDRICLGDFRPDLVVLLDIDVEDMPKRLGKQREEGKHDAADRFHHRGSGYYRHLVEVYRARARKLAHNHVVVDARADIEATVEQVCEQLRVRLLEGGEDA